MSIELMSSAIYAIEQLIADAKPCHCTHMSDHCPTLLGKHTVSMLRDYIENADRELLEKEAGIHVSQQDGVFVEKSQFDLMLTKANLELIQKVDKLLDRKPFAEEHSIKAAVDIGHNSLQLIFKSREHANEFKHAHKLKG